MRHVTVSLSHRDSLFGFQTWHGGDATVPKILPWTAPAQRSIAWLTRPSSAVRRQPLAADFYTDYRSIKPAEPRAPECVRGSRPGRAGRPDMPSGYCSGGWPASTAAAASRNRAVWRSLMALSRPLIPAGARRCLQIAAERALPEIGQGAAVHRREAYWSCK